MVGVLYKCMYLECTTTWKLRPIKMALEVHLIEEHKNRIGLLNEPELKLLSKTFLQFIDLQYKRAV